LSEEAGEKITAFAQLTIGGEENARKLPGSFLSWVWSWTTRSGAGKGRGLKASA
jgi:hypothetical protein